MKPLACGSLVRIRLGYSGYTYVATTEDLNSPEDYFRLRFSTLYKGVDHGDVITVLEEKSFLNSWASKGTATYVKVALNTGQVGWIPRRNLAII